MTVRWRRRAYAVVALSMGAVLVAATAGCSKSGSGGGSNEKITLIVDVFGTFGYEELYKQYEQQNPNIKIEERGTGANLGDYTPKLLQYLASGAGAGDLVAIEEGTLVQTKGQASKFEDLKNYGAAADEGNFLPWKWQQGQTADGKLLGLGTDVGSMAMCYRSDLFAAAGLPTKREDVSALWKTWDDYINVGKTFKSKVPNAGFIDAGTNTFNLILMQMAGAGNGYTYYDKSNNLVVDSNPVVKQAWDQTMKVISAGLSAKLQSWTDGWTTGFKNAQFATIACPAWMTGVIKGNAGDGAFGKWDIAAAPGGGGNWGGSFLAVPSQGKHKAEAAKLARFLTSPQGQIEAFKSKGNLPSSPQALADTSVKNAVNDYFSNAPTGQIYAAGATALRPVYLGPKNQDIRDQVENAIRSVEQGSATPDAAWTKAVADAKKVAA
ncbi:MAG: ABC transporter substrate-binding protein [Micromonosporaceae bacterium]